MNKIILFSLILICVIPSVNALTFEEFVAEFFVFTGMVVFEIKEESKSLDKFEEIVVPENKKIEIGLEDVEKEGSESSKSDSKSESTKKNSNKSSRKNKFIPECSDFFDNNINYLKAGTCKDNSKKILNEPLDDYCSEDQITLMEFFCNSDEICEGNWYVCPNGCESGACLTKKKEDFEPDLNILSAGNDIHKGVVSIKNEGSKGTYFKLKSNIDNIQETSDVNYYLEPGETIEVGLNQKIFGQYNLEVLSEEDTNQENNFLNGSIPYSTKNNEQKITGTIISSENINHKNIKKNSVIIDFLKFLRKFF